MAEGRPILLIGRWVLAAAAAVATYVAAGYFGLFALLLGPFPQDLAMPTAAFVIILLPVLVGARLAPSHRLGVALLLFLAAAAFSLGMLDLPLMPVLGAGAGALALTAWWEDRRRTARQTALAAGAAALLLVAFSGLVAARHLDWPARADGLPSALADLLGTEAPLASPFYDYDLGGFIDREYLWRFAAPPEVAQRLVDGLRLSPSGIVPAAFWRMPPRDWPVAMPAGARAFASPAFAAEGRGQDGVHYFLLHDEAAGKVYVWVKDNF